MQTITVRSRGQITVPETLRRMLSWLQEGSAVTMVHNDDEVIIRPFTKGKQINWQEVWDSVNLSRSFVGEKGDLSGFVTSDRDNH